MLLIITIGLTSVSCNKYEDGPKLSLRTKKARLSGDWKIEKVLYNGTDVTSSSVAFLGSNYELDLEKDGKLKESGNGFSYTGTWKLGEDKDDVEFKYDNNPGSATGEESYRILKLKNKELWLKHTSSNGDVSETHLIQ
ncbi:MAG: lipocalin-like domain-containing protein [Bacteroidia bacterium]